MNATARVLKLPPSQTKPAVTTRQSKLWLCAYFPELALTAAGLDLASPAALQVLYKGRACLYSISASARQAGVETGMSPSVALALCPGMQLGVRDSRQEQIALNILADVALEFSPWVSMAYTNALLLEVSTCLSLFGGAERLCESVQQAMQNVGHQPSIALTPSSAASELLARLGVKTILQRPADLRSSLGPLPLTALNLDDSLLKRLSRIGVQTLTDVWRLPRDGLARRYGSSLLRHLDELAGNGNRVLSQFHRPPCFSGRRELPTELEKLAHFFPAVEQLTVELANFLQQTDAAVLAVTLILHHYRRPASRIDLSFRHANRYADHCSHLLQEKLERTALSAPVLAVELVSEAIAPFQPKTFSLLDDDQDCGYDWQTALEELQTRLGYQSLQYPSAADDHRPERAGFLADSAGIAAAPPLRPIWLLPKPETIDPADLHCLPDIERIESGWWDGASVRRDYRVAYDRSGRKLWVFRDLKPGGGWYCHGLFG